MRMTNYEIMRKKPFVWQRFWAAVGVIETIGIVVLCVWILAGCHKPTFSLVHVAPIRGDVPASKPEQTPVETTENTQTGDPHSGGDALENDPRWNQLKQK